MKSHIGNKRTKKVKIPKRTYEVLVTVTDDGSDGAGGYAYITLPQIKKMFEPTGIWAYAGVKTRVVAIQELPLREV